MGDMYIYEWMVYVQYLDMILKRVYTGIILFELDFSDCCK